jgi:hypothetical protein
MQDTTRQGSTLCRPTHHRRRKVHSDLGACCVPIAATTAKVPRCQRSLLLVDVRSFWEIAAVVVKPEVHPFGLVVPHLSPRHGYLIHAMRQRWMPGSGVRILALVRSGSAEGWIGFPEVIRPSRPGLSYLRRSPYLPTFPPHRLTLRLLPDLSTHISVKPTSIRQCYPVVSRTCECPTREPK